jgi:hypothetical protein
MGKKKGTTCGVDGCPEFKGEKQHRFREKHYKKLTPGEPSAPQPEPEKETPWKEEAYNSSQGHKVVYYNGPEGTPEHKQALADREEDQRQEAEYTQAGKSAAEVGEIFKKRPGYGKTMADYPPRTRVNSR